MTDEDVAEEEQSLGQEPLDEGAEEGAPEEEWESLVGDRLTPEKDETLAWILKGFGREVESAVRHRAGQEAGEDAGQTFYELEFAECRLAIRADCMKAYMSSASKLTSLTRLAEVVSECSFHEPAELSSKWIQNSLFLAPVTWIQVSAGKEPRPAGSADYLYPGEPAHVCPAVSLRGLSAELERLLEADELDEALVHDFRGLAAAPGEVIARVEPDREEEEGHDVFGRPITPDHRTAQPEAGTNVEKVGNEFRATRFGYVVLLNNKLSVVSPVFVDNDRVTASWCILDQRPRPVSSDMITPWLADLAVVEGIQTEAIDRLAQEIAAGRHRLGLHEIASGTAPIHGKAVDLRLLLDRDRRYGELRDDGSRALAQVNFGPNVTAGQEIARLTPATKGTDGRDVNGNPVAGIDGIDSEVKASAAVRSETDADGVVHYFAESDGALKSVPGEIAVVDTLIIEGDVGFETGNLQFKGEVVVKGNIGQGFKVQATGDIIVFGKVDAGATVASGGNVVIGEGIIGRKTTIVARGHVLARFVHESQVRTAGDIMLADYAQGASMRADSRIAIAKSNGKKGGSVIGGRTWGMRGFDIYVAGSGSFATTELASGVDPTQARNLDLLNRKLDESNKLVMRQLSRFQMDKLDVVTIQKLLAASTGPQKKVLARAAKQLGEMVQLHQRLLARKKETQDGMADRMQDVAIHVKEVVHPGVEVRIGDQSRKIKDEMESPLFRLKEGRMEVRQN